MVEGLAECVCLPRKSNGWPGYTDGRFKELLAAFWELIVDGSEWDGLERWMDRMRVRYAEDEGLKAMLGVEAKWIRSSI
jgi:hypothetical protein